MHRAVISMVGLQRGRRRRGAPSLAGGRRDRRARARRDAWHGSAASRGGRAVLAASDHRGLAPRRRLGSGSTFSSWPPGGSRARRLARFAGRATTPPTTPSQDVSRRGVPRQVDRFSELASNERPVALVSARPRRARGREQAARSRRRATGPGARRDALKSALRGDDVLGRLGGTSSRRSYSPTSPAGGRAPDGRRVRRGRAHARPAPEWPGPPRDGTGAEALLAAADVALRVSKRSVGGTVRLRRVPLFSAAADGVQAGSRG